MVTHHVTKDYIKRMKPYVIKWLWDKYTNFKIDKNIKTWGKIKTIQDMEKEYFDKLSCMEQSSLVTMWRDEPKDRS